MKETNVQRSIMMAVSKLGTRIFRNNVGTAWNGKNYATKDGKRVIENAQLIRFGLCKGSSDLIGYTSKTITPDMIGQKVAVFTAIEVKKKGGKQSPEQINFIKRLNDAGGFGGFAYSEAEAAAIIQNK